MLLAAVTLSVAISGCIGSPLGESTGAPGGAQTAPGPAGSSDGVPPDPLREPTSEPPGESAPERDPELRVEDLRVSNVTATSAVVAFTVGPSDEVESRVVVRQTGWPEARTAWSSGTVARNVTLTDLAPGRTHGVAVEARAGSEVRRTPEVVFETEDLAWADAGSALVRPGVEIVVEGGGCTLGFIATSPDNATVYGLTAGHCLKENATVQSWPGGPVFGAVEVFEFGDDPVEEGGQWYDWGLVRIRHDLRGDVSPSVVGWTGPTGVSPWGALGRADEVCYRGHPNDLRHVGLEERCGLFHRYVRGGDTSALPYGTAGIGIPAFATDPGMDWATWDGHAAVGDSGGPLVDPATGAAVSLITHSTGWEAVAAPHGDWGMVAGPLVESILARAAEVGYPLRLATAPYVPADWPSPPAG